MSRQPASARPMVLVVEDEPLVMMLETEVLHDAGYSVIEASSADQAFEVLRSRPSVRAVLTDVEMPGHMDGFEFARLVRQGWPDMAVVVVSGRREPAPGDIPAGTTFLAKPFRPEQLVEIVGALIRRQGLTERRA